MTIEVGECAPDYFLLISVSIQHLWFSFFTFISSKIISRMYIPLTCNYYCYECFFFHLESWWLSSIYSNRDSRRQLSKKHHWMDQKQESETVPLDTSELHFTRKFWISLFIRQIPWAFLWSMCSKKTYSRWVCIHVYEMRKII